MTSASKSSNPVVSVVIPAYNAELWIEETLKSVLNQTYRNLEIIVVDDGSSDATVDVVRAMVEVDARIALVSQENGVVGSARNHGIRLASGAYVAPLDADDLWHPDKIEKQLQRFTECANQGEPVGMVYCWSQSIDEGSRLLRTGTRAKPIEGHVFDQLCLENFVGNGSSPLIDAALLRQVGGYQEQMPAGCEDWTLYLSIAHESAFGAVPEYLVGYRQLNNSMSRNIQRMVDAHEAMIEILREKKTAVPRTGIRDGRTLLLYWMLTSSKLFSGTFWRLIRRLFYNDPLFMLRRVFLLKIKGLMVTRVFRIGYAPLGPDRPLYLESF